MPLPKIPATARVHMERAQQTLNYYTKEFAEEDTFRWNSDNAAEIDSVIENTVLACMAAMEHQLQEFKKEIKP